MRESGDPFAWKLLGAAGLLFFLVGGFDVALTWFPFGTAVPSRYDAQNSRGRWLLHSPSWPFSLS
jgi:hypothetical protein